MKVGFANGCFDLFHQGHIHFLTQCRGRCDYLVVAVNSDDYIAREKGQGRPFDSLQRRMFNVRTIAEAVFPFEGREDNLLMEIRPDVVFKGYDHSSPGEKVAMRKPRWRDGEFPEMWIAPVVRIGHLPGFSTTLAAEELARAQKGDDADGRSQVP